MRPIDVVDRGAAAHPQRAALVGPDVTLDYAEVRAVTCRIAQRLHAGGFSSGAHGAVLAPNEPIGFACALSLLRAGVTWVPINPYDAVPQVGLLLDRLDVSVLFVHSSFTAHVDELRGLAPRVSEVVVYDEQLDDWLGEVPASDVAVADDPDAVAAIFPTSGTTGLPRGVMHSNRSFEVFINSLPTIAPHDGPPVFLAAAPLTHVSGRIALSVMAGGGTTVILHRADPASLLDTLDKHAVTMTMLPPTVIYALTELPGIDERSLPALKYIGYGSAPTRIDKLARALEVFGPVMLQNYGQTEAPMLISSLSAAEHLVDGRLPTDNRLASVGRPTPFVTATILDDAGNEVPRGEVGEVCVRGDFVMVGYYRDSEATAAASRHGWHHTGDLGYFDEGGFLYLVDRKKDMIISGGFNVYPAEVERVIVELPGVCEVAVIGVPHERWGEAVTAIVIPEQGASVDPALVVEEVKRRLGSVKAPKTVEFRTEFPRNATGKVLKRVLREQYSS